VTEADQTWSSWADGWPAPVSPDTHERDLTAAGDDPLAELWRDPIWGERPTTGPDSPVLVATDPEAFVALSVAGSSGTTSDGAAPGGAAVATEPISRFASAGLHDDLLPQHTRRRGARR